MNKTKTVAGELSGGQLQSLLENMGVELTFIDEEDRIRFFATGPNPIFERDESILGTDVMACHPQETHDAVRRMLDEMKAGVIDEMTEPLKQKGTKVIHVRYVALRDEEGNYRGCLEVVQDIAAYRS